MFMTSFFSDFTHVNTNLDQILKQPLLLQRVQTTHQYSNPVEEI